VVRICRVTAIACTCRTVLAHTSTVAHIRQCDTAAVLNDMKFSLATAFVEPFALVQCCFAKATVSQHYYVFNIDTSSTSNYTSIP
jgi:hypothetical protein